MVHLSESTMGWDVSPAWTKGRTRGYQKTGKHDFGKPLVWSDYKTLRICSTYVHRFDMCGREPGVQLFGPGHQLSFIASLPLELFCLHHIYAMCPLGLCTFHDILIFGGGIAAADTSTSRKVRQFARA